MRPTHVRLPSVRAARDVRERPLLAVLEAAARACEVALLAEHPTLDSSDFDDRSAPTLIAADLLLGRLVELRSLLATYLAIVAIVAPDDTSDDLNF